MAGRRRPPALKSKIKAYLKGSPPPKPRPSGSHFDRAPYTFCTVKRPGPVSVHDVPDADVVIATWWETSFIVADLPCSKGIKAYFMQDYGAATQTIEQILPTWQLSIPMITISNWLENLVRKHVPHAQIQTVSNGIDLEKFYPPEDNSAREHVGVVFNGLPTKRVPLAVEAVGILRARYPELLLHVIGSPKQAYDDFVRPTGRISDDQVRQIYSSCKAWIFPSKIEGYGLPILESMACGTPVVATPAGAAPELLESGGGVLVDSDDPSDLADAVERVLNMEDDQWRAMSRAARAEAERHSWSVIGDQMEAALLSILETANR